MRFLIKDLQRDTAYRVQLRTNDGKDVSKWSQKFDLQTVEGENIPLAPVLNFWTPEGQAFHAGWNPVTQDTASTSVKIDHYEVELVANSIIKIVSVTPTTGSEVLYTLSPYKNRKYFNGIQSSVRIRVRAVTPADKKSAWSSPLTSTFTGPDIPTNFVAEGIEGGISLSWDMDTTGDVVRYDLHVGTAAGFTPTTLNRVYSGYGNAYIYNTLTITQHFFQLFAVNAFGLKSAAATADSTPLDPFLVDITPPDVPSLSATLTNNANGIGAKASVTWTLATVPDDLAGFWLRWRKVGDTSWSQAPYQKDDRSAIVELQSAFTNYEFQIASADSSANNSAWSATYTATSPANTAPQTVTGLTATPGRDAITYKWNAVTDTDIKNYEVTFSTSSTFATGNITYLTGTATSLTVGGLNPGTTYYARVRAVDQGGLTSAAWSATNTTATTAFPVTPLSDGNPPASSPTPVVASGIGYLHVSWPSITNNDIVTYEVHISTTTGFTPAAGTKVAELAGTAIVLEKDAAGANLAYGTTYYIKTIAKDRDGAAPASAQASGSPAKVTGADVTLSSGDITGAASTTYVDNAVSTSASGKNKIVRSTSAASGTTEYIAGDSWYQYSGTDVIGFWIYSGTAWVSQALSNSVISSLDAGKINTGYLDANRINANTIGVEKLIVADLTNVCANPGFESGALAPHVLASSTFALSAAARSGANAGLFTTTALSGNLLYPNGAPSRAEAHLKVKVGDTIRFSAWAMNNVGTQNINLIIQIRDSTGATVLQSGSTGYIALTGAYTQYATEYTVTSAGAYYAFCYIAYNGSTIGNSVLIDDMEIRRKFGGELIVDGSIAANKITAGTYTGGEFIIGTGGILRTAGSEVTLTSSGITVTGANSSISATALTTGTFGSGNTLTINGNALLNGNMQVQTGGYIKSTEYVGTTYAAASAAGWYLGRDGLRISTGAVSASALTTGTLGSSTGIINIAAGASIIMNGGYLKSNTNTGTSMSTAVTSGAGFYLGNDGLFIGGGTNGGQIKANALISDTLTSTTITLGTGGTISGPGFTLSGTGLNVTSGTIAAAAITLTSAFNNSVVAGTTVIDGGKINTGIIQSTNYNGTTGQPMWSINLNGAATFTAMKILGNTVLGTSSTDSTSFIQSSNYVAGSTGWRITANGDTEFNAGVYRGMIRSVGTSPYEVRMMVPGGGSLFENPSPAVAFFTGQTYPGYLIADTTTIQLYNPYSGTTSNRAYMSLSTLGAEFGGAGTVNFLNRITAQLGNNTVMLDNVKSGRRTVSTGWSGTNPVVQTVTVSQGIPSGGTYGVERSTVATIYGANAENWEVSVMNQTSTGFDLRIVRVAGGGTSVDVNWITMSQ